MDTINREQIRVNLGITADESMREFLDRNVDEESINDFLRSPFVGKVVENQDPDQIGRCKVRVFGLFGNEVPDDDLPWALPDHPFVGSKVGGFVVPPIGALVKIYFDNGEIYFPHYSTKVVDKNNLPKQRLVDYPDNIVLLETDDGTYITVNRKTIDIKVHHSSGSEMMMNKKGEAVLHGNKKVRLDGVDEVVLGDSGGYVVTSPNPGQIITQDGHILTAQKKGESIMTLGQLLKVETMQQSMTLEDLQAALQGAMSNPIIQKNSTLQSTITAMLAALTAYTTAIQIYSVIQQMTPQIKLATKMGALPMNPSIAGEISLDVMSQAQSLLLEASVKAMKIAKDAVLNTPIPGTN